VVSAYFGGRIDMVIQRFMDVLLSFPIIVLALAVVAVLGKFIVGGLDLNLIVAIAIPMVPKVARVVRASWLVRDLVNTPAEDMGPSQLEAEAEASMELGAAPEHSLESQFKALEAEDQNVADVEIVSATTLGDEQKARLAAALRTRLRRDVRLQCSVDPELIGGAVVRSGDLLIDGSLKGKLERLETELTG